MIICLLGCASSNYDLITGDEYGKTSRDRLIKLHEDQIPSVSDDPTINIASSSEMTSDELETLGDLFLKKGNLHKAFLHYEKSLKQDPENIRVLYKKGLTFVVGGINEKAVKVFIEVLQRDDRYAPAYKGLGQAYFQMREYDRAEKNLKQAVELDSKLWKAHNLLGISYSYQKRYEIAIDEYNKAILIKPDEGILYNNLGLSYFLMGEYEEAVDAFQNAIETKFSTNKVYNNLGLALFREGRYEDALESFRKGGDEAQAFNNLGSLFLSTGEFEKSIEYFEKAIALSPAFYSRAGENLRRAKMALGLQ
jgi:tetratricopeptide (TPR) repeat protein